MKIFSELQSHEFLMEHVFCPHRAVRELPSVSSQDHAMDEVCFKKYRPRVLEAQLTYQQKFL